MPEPNLTYYFGQIKPEFQGDRILLIDSLAPYPRLPQMREVLLSSKRSALEETVCPSPLPLRTYIGVNENAKVAILDAYRRNGRLHDLFTLDEAIVGIFVVSNQKAVWNALSDRTLVEKIKSVER